MIGPRRRPSARTRRSRRRPPCATCVVDHTTFVSPRRSAAYALRIRASLAMCVKVSPVRVEVGRPEHLAVRRVVAARRSPARCRNRDPGSRLPRRGATSAFRSAGMSPLRVEEEARDVVVVDEVDERLGRRRGRCRSAAASRAVVGRASTSQSSGSGSSPAAASASWAYAKTLLEHGVVLRRSRRRCRALPGMRVAAVGDVVAVERLAEHDEVVLALLGEPRAHVPGRRSARSRSRRASIVSMRKPSRSS